MLQRAQSGGKGVYHTQKGFYEICCHIVPAENIIDAKLPIRTVQIYVTSPITECSATKKQSLPPEYVGFPRRRANRRTLQVVIVHRSTYNLTMDGEKASFFNMRTLGLPKFFCYFFISPLPSPFRF